MTRAGEAAATVTFNLLASGSIRVIILLRVITIRDIIATAAREPSLGAITVTWLGPSLSQKRRACASGSEAQAGWSRGGHVSACERVHH